jgi:hypothetical protein
MDDILYILIGVIWLILGIYQNKQKQKSKAVKKPVTEPIQNNEPVKTGDTKPKIKDFFDEFFPDEELKSEEKPFSYEDIDVQETPSFVYQHPQSYNLEKEDDINAYKNEIEYKTESKILNEFDDSYQENELIDEFDAKKAILYSAIIQRPYN